MRNKRQMVRFLKRHERHYFPELGVTCFARRLDAGLHDSQQETAWRVQDARDWHPFWTDLKFVLFEWNREHSWARAFVGDGSWLGLWFTNNGMFCGGDYEEWSSSDLAETVEVLQAFDALASYATGLLAAHCEAERIATA